MSYFLRKGSYEANVYNWLKRKGLADKYEHAGIYCIKLDGQLVYIGKSRNMLRRIAEHYVGIQKGSEKKYRLIAEAQRNGCNVDFDVLYYAKGGTESEIRNDIGRIEGELIRQYMPPLNTQIPHEDDWHKHDVRKMDVEGIRTKLIEKGGTQNGILGRVDEAHS